MKIALTVGHSKLANGNYTSANGIVNEYEYNKALAPLVAKYLGLAGHSVTVIICPEGKFTASTQERDYKLNVVNNGGYDLVVELHLNAFNKTAKGTEVLYYSTKGKVIAERIQAKLATLFSNRGTELRDNLYMLTRTNPTAVMIESFFCDNAEDCSKGSDKAKVAKLIAEGIAGTAINEPSPAPVSTKIYRVQVGAFGNKENADRLAAELKSKGYAAIVV